MATKQFFKGNQELLCALVGISLVDETEASSGDTLLQASDTQELVKGLQFAYEMCHHRTLQMTRM